MIRQRARDAEGNVYTLLGPLPRRGPVTVRDQHGFVRVLQAKTLTPIPADEPGSFLRFGDDA